MEKMMRFFSRGRATKADDSRRTEMVTKTESFAARKKLELRNIYGDVKLGRSGDGKIHITLKGRQELVDSVQMSMNLRAVVVQMANLWNGTTVNNVVMGNGCVVNNIGGVVMGNGNVVNNCVINNGNTVVINSGGSTIVNASSSKTKLEIEVLIPMGTAVLYEGRGTSTLKASEDTKSEMDLGLSGVCEAELAEVAGLTAEVSGKSSVVVQRMDGGNVRLEVSGSSSAYILGVRVDFLMAEVGGTSEVRVDAVARMADLEASGMSLIVVKEVTGRARQDSSGMARIVVRR